MGLLRFQNRSRNYWMELDDHFAKRKLELPIEKLGAVFIETAGMHAITVDHMQRRLDITGTPFAEDLEYKEETENNEGIARIRDIIEKAKQNGTEVWMGDVKPTGLEILAAFANGAAHPAVGLAAGHFIGKSTTQKFT